MRSAELVELYVRGLSTLLGARAVSVYLPAAPRGIALSHDGADRPLPELADLAQAERFAEAAAAEAARLRSTRPGTTGVELPSRVPDGRLIGIFSGPPERVPDRRGGRATARANGHGPELWLGLRTSATPGPFALPPPPPGIRSLESPLSWLLGFAGVLGRHSVRVSEILDDPVTGLSARVEFQADLERAVEDALAEERPLTLLMINPDEFAAVNHRLNREHADDVVREIADRLRARHRSSDVVARYGSVVFTSLLAGADAIEGRRRAQEVLDSLHERPFAGGAVPLRFSLGLACLEPGDKRVRGALDLIRRADAALGAAKNQGGGAIVVWQPRLSEEAGYLDRLSGIFTGRLAKDYRNMAVLSDTIAVLAKGGEPRELSVRVVEGLHAAMKPERVGLFEWPDDGGPRLVYGISRSGLTSTPVESLDTSAEERRLLDTAVHKRRTAWLRGGAGGDETLGFALPLLAGETCLGVLYLAGSAAATSFDATDLVFLEALATQVALALDRARLTERQRQQEEQEKQRLLAEVAELRTALQRTQIVYRSGTMDSLLERVRRVAPTDATVLITGESGTGKELFARALHELSPRRGQPFVVVDCGAIPTTLLESELFGHEKGSFTGAETRQLGRLVQADHGTLLLDEIGELPLEAQSRFLRFVQEKHVTPVGGRTGRTVDVRVVAATNRDLQAEVAAGRFRADFYHRLNVVRLDIAPLRARTEDVLHLAAHFCRVYALMYGRPTFAFAPEAEEAVLRHAWPGNVRELQNRVMRAVILAQGETLSPADLGLDDALPGLRPAAAAERHPALEPRATGGWQGLRTALREQVALALAGKQSLPPLGRWVADDLVLEANQVAGSVATTAAATLGVPTTTLRRRLAAAQAQAGAGWSPRPAAWPNVRAALGDVLRTDGASGRNLLKQVLALLLEEVVLRTGTDARAGAALMGITLTTFRRRLDGRTDGDDD
jgi:diguanylate cyclase (GGDEF)-like protein